jgi:hypothetical protein
MAVRDVVIRINGGQHVLRSDLGAWAAVEDAGEDYLALIKRLNTDGPKMRAVLLLFWAYLDHETPRPSLEEVKRWVTSENFGMVTKAVAEAFRDGQPEATESSGPPTADAGTGQPSASAPPVSKSRRVSSGV